MVWICKNGHKQKKMPVTQACICKVCGKRMFWFEERKYKGNIDFNKLKEN